jgi:hypothetical protein
MWRDWTRNEKIGFASLIATIIGTLATIAAIPDTRVWLFGTRQATLGINAASVLPFARGQRVVISEEQLRRLCGLYLTEHDVAGLSGSELEILRNSIFALHGRPFDRKNLRDIFDRQRWYRTDANYDDSRLSTADWHNIELIRRAEQARGFGGG